MYNHYNKCPIGNTHQNIHHRDNSQGQPERLVDPLDDDPDKGNNAQGNVEQQKEDLPEGQQIKPFRVDNKDENEQECPKAEDRTDSKQALAMDFSFHNTTSL